MATRLLIQFYYSSAMKTTSIRILVAASACRIAAPVGAAQAGAEPTLPVLTVCEALSAPMKYNGRILTIRGRPSGSDEGYWVNGDGCPGVVTTDGFMWPSEISLAMPTLPRPLRLHSVDFTYDWDARHRLDAKYKRLRKRVPQDCLVFTYTGLFETRTDWSAQKMVYANGRFSYAGFGHLGEAPAQLLLRSEDDVEAIPNCGRNGNASSGTVAR